MTQAPARQRDGRGSLTSGGPAWSGVAATVSRRVARAAAELTPLRSAHRPGPRHPAHTAHGPTRHTPQRTAHTHGPRPRLSGPRSLTLSRTFSTRTRPMFASHRPGPARLPNPPGIGTDYSITREYETGPTSAHQRTGTSESPRAWASGLVHGRYLTWS